MRKCGRSHQKSAEALRIRSMKEGFSLIEVIIAVALLAFMALPILAYFTNAAVTTSRGKNTQKATMAAESVLEELNAFDTLEQMEKYLKEESEGSSDWSITQAESMTGESGKSSTTTVTKKNITVDDSSYNAKVTLEYDYPLSTANPAYTNPNQKEMPDLKEVYSSENAVIKESDQMDRAVSHYLMKYPNETSTGIIDKLERELHLDIMEQDEIYTVTGSYHYIYNGNADDSYDAVVTRTKIKDPANVYFFYRRMYYETGGSVTVRNNQERVIVTADTDDSDKTALKEHMGKVHIYFVCQKEGGESSIATSCKLEFHGSSGGPVNGAAAEAYYHTNVEAVTPPGKHKQELVTSSARGRIARVVVDVYLPEDSSMSDSLAHLESSKGE